MSNPKDRGDQLTDCHNSGQSDYSDGKYEPPHHIGFFDGIIYPESSVSEWVKDNEAYDAGYNNARNNK